MPPSKPKAKLLIVDDEAAQMKALCQTLDDSGYQTTGYCSAKEALAALGAAKFDLLLTDLVMPEMDGITLLDRARKIDADLVGIVMTGHAAVDTAVEAMKAGAMDYILKPFKLSAITPVLERALAVRRLRLENQELQERVLQRTAELEAANKELESFSYSVSHDLRAPLRSIDGFSEILAKEYGAQMPAEAQRLLGKVCTQAHRMQNLVEDLLRLSRLGRQQLALRSVNMAGLVKEVLEQLQPERAGQAVEIQVGKLPGAEGDAGLLGQVWLNLLGNALKFTRKREGARVEIGCEEGRDEFIYSVRDNGAGFDMKYADKLFGVFQRLHPSDEFEGTGIGLSIVQRIIHRHGGRIWAEGKVGEGATFYFSLPKQPAGASAGDLKGKQAGDSPPIEPCPIG